MPRGFVRDEKPYEWLLVTAEKAWHLGAKQVRQLHSIHEKYGSTLVHCPAGSFLTEHHSDSSEFVLMIARTQLWPI